MPAVTGFADLAPVEPLARGASREGRVALPLESIPAGMYLARATVKSGADTLAEVDREVDVRPGRRPATAADTSDTGTLDARELVNGDLARRYVSVLKRNVAAPGTTEALRGMEALGRADCPAAIAAFRAALDANQGDAAAAFFEGWAFVGAGDDRSAISAWRRAAFIDPTMVPVHLALADIYTRLSQPALAAQALRAGLAALPQSTELADRLARIERK